MYREDEFRIFAVLFIIMLRPCLHGGVHKLVLEHTAARTAGKSVTNSATHTHVRAHGMTVGLSTFWNKLTMDACLLALWLCAAPSMESTSEMGI